MSNWTSPPAVSAKLRKAGFGIVATRNREGIRVTRGALKGWVNVTVDLDRPGEADRLADTLEDWMRVNIPAYNRNGVHFTIRGDL